VVKGNPKRFWLQNAGEIAGKPFSDNGLRQKRPWNSGLNNPVLALLSAFLPTTRRPVFHSSINPICVNARLCRRDDRSAASVGNLISHLRGALIGTGNCPPEAQRHFDQLNPDFGDLREPLQCSDSSLAEALNDPILHRFVETLDVGAAGRLLNFFSMLLVAGRGL
jgi:hypothetical protein